MTYLANLGLLLDFVLFCAINYQLSWSVTTGDILGTAWRRVSQATARRCYYLALLLSVLAILVLIAHVAARNVINAWPELTPLCVGIAGLLLVVAAILEFAVVRQF